MVQNNNASRFSYKILICVKWSKPQKRLQQFPLKKNCRANVKYPMEKVTNVSEKRLLLTIATVKRYGGLEEDEEKGTETSPEVVNLNKFKKKEKILRIL